MNGAIIIFHAGCDARQAVVLENSQADRSSNKIGLDCREEASDVEMGNKLSFVPGAICIRGENLQAVRVGSKQIAGFFELTVGPVPDNNVLILEAASDQKIGQRQGNFRSG